MVWRLYGDNASFNNGYIKEEDIVELAKNNDNYALEYLLKRYKKFILHKSKNYFIVGAEREDLMQEGLIGLYKAIMAYDIGKTISFRSFAYLCISRQIITAIKSATRQKHSPLNSYISLQKPVYEDESYWTLQDIIISEEILDPMDIYINSERLQNIENRINKKLSELERMILIPYINGKSYKEIAVETKKTEKCIDNALQRIRRKLGEYVLEAE